MSELGVISNNSSNNKEELQNFYLKLNSGSPVNENYLLNLINNNDLSPDILEVLEKIAIYFKEKKRTELAYSVFKRLSLYSDKYLGEVIDLALSQGELFLAELAGRKYLNYLVQKKNFKIGTKIIDDLSKAGLGKDYVNNFRLIFSVLNGDIKAFEKLSGNLKNNFSNYGSYRMILSIVNSSKGKDKKWENLKEFKKFKLLKMFFWIKDLDPDNISLRKEFFNYLFEFKCFYPEDNFGLILLSKYARFFNCEALVSTVNDYLQNNKKKITKEDYYNALEKVGTYREELDITLSQKSEKEDKKISFLGKKILGFEEIKDKEFFINEKCFIKVCELLEDELINRFYSDLTICFLTMGFYEVANSILNRVENIIESLSLLEKINHEYLRISIFLNQKKFWEVSSRVDNLLLNYPLLPEEQKCFLYLKAEANFFLGRRNEAKEIYLKILKTSPNYRLVENRLFEIETNK